MNTMKTTPQMMLRANRYNGLAKDTSRRPASWNVAEPTSSTIEPDARPNTNFAMSRYFDSSGSNAPSAPWGSKETSFPFIPRQENHQVPKNRHSPTKIPYKPGK